MGENLLGTGVIRYGLGFGEWLKGGSVFSRVQSLQNRTMVRTNIWAHSTPSGGKFRRDQNVVNPCSNLPSPVVFVFRVTEPPSAETNASRYELQSRVNIRLSTGMLKSPAIKSTLRNDRRRVASIRIQPSGNRFLFETFETPFKRYAIFAQKTPSPMRGVDKWILATFRSLSSCKVARSP